MSSAEIKRLDELASIQYGFPFDSKHFGETGRVRVVRIRDIKGKLEPTFYDGEYEKEYEVGNGDILVGMDGEFNCMVWQGGKAILNQRMAKVVPKERIVDKFYLFYLLRKRLKSIEEQITGSTVKHLLDPQLRGIEIPTPSFHIQQRIGAVLKRAEGLCAIREQANQLTNKIIQSVFLKMFGDPIKNTKGFELKKLPTVAKLERGKFGYRPRTEPRFYGGKYPFIQIGDIPRDSIYIRSYTQTLNEKGLAISKMFPRGTIVIAIAATIGEVGILGFNSCFPDSLVGITPDQSHAKPEYLYLFLTFMKKRLTELAPLTAQRNINLKILSEIDVPIPPTEQQQKFSEFVQKAERMRARQEASTKEINELFRSLMYKAFRGELV